MNEIGFKYQGKVAPPEKEQQEQTQSQTANQFAMPISKAKILMIKKIEMYSGVIMSKEFANLPDSERQYIVTELVAMVTLNAEDDYKNSILAIAMNNE